MNKVILVGRLGKDPELGYTQSGTPNCKFSLATTEFSKDKDGTPGQKTMWHNIVIWGKTAENVAKYIRKGSQVLVEGKINNRSYVDKSGEKKYISEVTCYSVEFLDSKIKKQDGNNNQYPKDKGNPYDRNSNNNGNSNNNNADDDDIPF